ncbi:MAG: DUF1015 family protein [Gammaproteobacteria bacterium]
MSASKPRESLVRPFRGLRPTPDQAGAVAAPPYDVLSSAEARGRAAGRPWSFLHISRAEIDLPEDTDPTAPEVYAKAAENMKKMVDAGVLIRDPRPCYYAYRLTMGDHSQTGVVVAASVAAYDLNAIRRHELTRPDKEDDRVRQIEAVNAQTGPVLVTHRPHVDIEAALSGVTKGAPTCDVTADDGVVHTLWVIDDATLIDSLTAAFNELGTLYIADGHHRSAAASRVAAKRRAKAANDLAEYFLAVAFATNQMRVLDYNRVVKDLNGLGSDEFLARIKERFAVETCDRAVKPETAHTFGMYLDGQWYRLTPKDPLPLAEDPTARLDVSLLHNRLIEPLLGIHDPRRDKRIDFVGGIRGMAELERRVDSGEMRVAFALYPTSMEELLAVADAGEMMPPKSTWFEPKLADGLVSYPLWE